MLAGYAFAFDETHTTILVRDRVNHYYIVRDVECDGANLDLLLTRDRKELKDLIGQVENVRGKPLPSLKTGKGIAIGDSPARAIAVLGRPTYRGPDGRYDVLTYSWHQHRSKHGDLDDRVYEQTYTFRAGRLVEIHFAWSPPDDVGVLAGGL
jgi:hypothetical protein